MSDRGEKHRPNFIRGRFQILNLGDIIEENDDLLPVIN